MRRVLHLRGGDSERGSGIQEETGTRLEGAQVRREIKHKCYDLSLFLLIHFLFCLSLCAAPCLALFAFLCACFIAYLCVVLGHILHDT